MFENVILQVKSLLFFSLKEKTIFIEYGTISNYANFVLTLSDFRRSHTLAVIQVTFFCFFIQHIYLTVRFSFVIELNEVSASRLFETTWRIYRGVWLKNVR